MLAVTIVLWWWWGHTPALHCMPRMQCTENCWTNKPKRTNYSIRHPHPRPPAPHASLCLQRSFCCCTCQDKASTAWFASHPPTSCIGNLHWHTVTPAPHPTPTSLLQRTCFWALPCCSSTCVKTSLHHLLQSPAFSEREKVAAPPPSECLLQRSCCWGLRFCY
jgi:hypothetical protein